MFAYREFNMRTILILWMLLLQSTCFSGTTGSSGGGSATNVSSFVTNPFVLPAVVVGIGDSLMSGGVTSVPTNYGFFTVLTNTIKNPQVRFATNGAAPGTTSAQMWTNYATTVTPYVPGAGTNGYLFVWSGINSLDVPNNEYYLSNTFTKAHSQGWKVVAFTITDRTDWTNSGTAAWLNAEAQRMTVNTWIRTNGMWDYLVDASLMFPDSDTNQQCSDGGIYVHFNTNSDVLLVRSALQQLAGFTPAAPLVIYQQLPVAKKFYPKFFAYQTATSTLTNSVESLVSFDSLAYDADPLGDFYGYKWQPQVAGYYSVSACVKTPAAGALSVLYIAKNTVDILLVNQPATGNTVGPVATTTVYLNGSSDYVAVHFYQSGGINYQTAGGSNPYWTFFTGYLLP